MDIQKVMVLGSGLMGSGIAQVCAQAGIQVVLNDVSREALDKATKNIAWSVGKFVEKGKVLEDKETIMSSIITTSSYEDGADADLVIEAVFENFVQCKSTFSEIYFRYS